MARPADSLGVYKDAWNDIEDYDKVILITWNPKPRFYNYDKHGENNFDMQWWTMALLLVEADRCCSRFAFVPELSEDGKLHMHGWYVVSDKVKYYKSFLPKLRSSGFIKKSKAKSHNWKTFRYHVKDLEETCDYVTELHDLPITHFNVKHVKKHYHLKKMLLSTNYDLKVKKRNVLQMLQKELLMEESSE